MMKRGARLLSRRAAGLTILTGISGALVVVASAAPFRPLARADLYNCEGCEAVGERAPEEMSASADLAGPDEPGERMILTGVVYQPNGETPAAGVVVYAHQTNAQGVYAGGSSQSVWSRRHGRLRGWVKTGAEGVYTFNTIKPAPYPDRSMPAHIHLMIGEPGKRPYYIDDVVFDGEFGVTEAYRRAQEFRGGRGIVKLETTADGVLLARRDITLETHPSSR